MILLALIWPILDVNNWVKNTNDESQSFFFGLKVTKYTSSARCILIVRQTRKKSSVTKFTIQLHTGTKTEDKQNTNTNHKHDSNKIQIKLTKHKTN